MLTLNWSYIRSYTTVVWRHAMLLLMMHLATRTASPCQYLVISNGTLECQWCPAKCAAVTQNNILLVLCQSMALVPLPHCSHLPL